MVQGKIRVPTVSQEVYKRLRNQIVTGELRPGQKVLIKDIAESYGVSTMPVRESFTKLESEGFISLSRRNAIIKQYSTKEVKEIFLIRKKLEIMAIEWAMENIDQSKIEELEGILKESDGKKTSTVEWGEMNKSFHLTLYSYANSKPLQKILENVWGMVESYMHIYASSESAVHSIHDARLEHYQMLTFLKEGKLEELKALTLNHLQKTCDVILHKLAE